ncbi:FBXL7 [Acanthosepion pharaonis]|uniref:FBXL7 n=1 Tax=Acanthosepion pharaonis TaxID=158019 RepID=A0A812AKD5_ACAPH|nr:FBXL7 [Sepia pharaonis]
MSTFKGSCSSSESLLDSRYSGWSSLSNNTSSYGKSCPTHNQPPQSTYNNSALRDFHNSAVGMDSINTKFQHINLEDTGKLILGIKKTKSHPRPSPFQQLSDDIISCSNITNPALFELVSNCVNLEHLNVSGCSNITCVSLANSILARAPAHYLHQVYLLYLDMSDCNLLDDRGLQILALHCSRLQFLYLRRSRRVSYPPRHHISYIFGPYVIFITESS